MRRSRRSSPRPTTARTASSIPTSGETIAQGRYGLPVFLANMQFTVTNIIALVGKEGGFKPGDHVDRQRSLCQRHAPAGHRAGVALLRRRRTVRAAREHRPLDGHRRQRAGRLGAEGDRDPPGRHHHPADEAVRRRQAERAAGEDVHQQCAPAGPDRGRSLGDVQRVQCRPARPRHAARALRTRAACRLHRRDDGPLGSADALLHRGDPGRRLSLRGLFRQ